mgnify:CR=1 FL=1
MVAWHALSTRRTEPGPAEAGKVAAHPPIAHRRRDLETQKLSFEDFKNIVVERLGCEPEQVTMDASFQEDLNADSLDLVELIYAFEENTGLEIPDEDAEKITTVGQAWEYIQEKSAS